MSCPRRRAVPWLLLAASVALGGCIGTSSASPEPAGPTPSSLATMVCKPKAEREISAVLDAASVRVSERNWAVGDHVYSCRYTFPQGALTLSVRELSSWSQTKGYFAQLGREHGDAHVLYGLGQAAFRTPDGSVVVRKDWKVMYVDASELTRRFPQGSSTVSGGPAEDVASVIMGCWSGD